MELLQAGPAVRINLSADRLGTFVYLDGVLVQGLRNVTLTHRAGEVASIVLEVLPSSLVIDGECRDVLIRLLANEKEENSDGGLPKETETETETPTD